MKATIGLLALAACASAPSTKLVRMTSAAPIDVKAAFATAIATVQERFSVVDIDEQHAVFATTLQRLDVPGVGYDVSYVVQLSHLVQGCGRRNCSSKISVGVTPIAFVGGAMVAPDQTPRAARDIADDLATTIRWHEQSSHVVY